MNPMRKNLAKNATSRPSRRTKSKKKVLGVNDAPVAETPSEFSFAVAKTVVAQICQSVGFKTSKCDALEALTNVSMKYLEAIAKSAASFANASSRTDSNLFDIVNGIHDLSSAKGFPGGSKLHKSNLLRSPALEKIIEFVNHSNEVPFAKPISFKNVSGSQNPSITIDSRTPPMQCFEKAKIEGIHIPRWLPEFPKESLYKKSQKVLVKERKCGEKLWEHSLALEACSGNVEENNGTSQSNGINGKEKDIKMELTEGRARVKFTIGGKEKHIGLGANLVNGVCKRRKRVSLNHGKINDCTVEENEDEWKGRTAYTAWTTPHIAFKRER